MARRSLASTISGYYYKNKARKMNGPRHRSSQMMRSCGDDEACWISHHDEHQPTHREASAV
eukprot:scaffold1933_cov165-Amphora_coffeaeformis.AAC.1